MSNLLKENTDTNLQPNVNEADKPLISVIIPTYNRLPLLLEAVESVRAQTYSNWELIIVDDGSTDGTAEAIQKIRDNRVHLIRLIHSGHIGQVLNEGVKHSKGKWLAFLDSDDLWLPDKLELQLNTLQKEKKKWCYGSFEYVNEKEKIIYKSSEKFPPVKGRITEYMITGEAGITVCSIIIEKRLFEESGGFSPDPEVRNDYEFILRMSLKEEIAFTPDIILKVRDHKGRVYKSRNYPHERSASTYKAFINLKPGEKFEKMAKKKFAFLLSEASVHRFANGEYKIALKLLSQSFAKDKLRHWLSALKRGIYAVYKKYFQHSAKKRKTEDVAAYTS